MKKSVCTSVLFGVIICASTVFNSCNDTSESRLESTSPANAAVLKGPMNKIPKSLWLAVANAQDDAVKYKAKLNKLSSDERLAAPDKTVYYFGKLASALEKVVDAYDEAYEDSSCIGVASLIENTTDSQTPEQKILAYVKKNHTEAFYNISKDLLEKGIMNITPKEIANSNKLSDDEKLRLTYIYIVDNEYKDNNDVDKEKDDECAKAYHYNAYKCDLDFHLAMFTVCLLDKKERGEAVYIATQNRIKGEKAALEEYKKCIGEDYEE